MRKNIAKVIAAFLRGESGTGDTKKTCSTSGLVIFSYAMPIAARRHDGSIVIVEYSAAPSNTTRSQVRACEGAFPGAERVAKIDPRDLRAPIVQVAMDRLGVAS